MILIHQISNSDLEYKDDIKECLNHNLTNPIIRKIVIFSSCIDLEKKIGIDLRSKKLLLLKFDLSLFDMMNYGKKNSKSFVIYGAPFIKFDVDLTNMLKFDVKKILKDDGSYYIFDRNLKIKNERDIDDILVGEKIKIFLKTEKLGYYKNSDFQSISYGWRVSKNIQKKDTTKVEEMSKVDIPLEEISKVDIVEESIVEIEKPKFEKIKNIIKDEYYTRKLDVVIVSVNYNDFLLISLENNSKIFESITVVTSSSDFLCQKICKKFGVKCLVTDIMYENGVVFNKGKAINEGIRSISEPDYILLLDADILVMEKIDVDSLEDDVLYTSNRYMIDNFDSYQSYISGEVDKDNAFVLEKNEGFGFFQLFNYGMDIKFPEDSDDASTDDIRFRNRFHLKKSIEKVILHLGKDSNWTGRKSRSFLEYEQFDTLLEKKHDLVDKTFKICTFYYNTQKDVRREENFLKFLAQFEGYQDNILIGMVDYDGDLIIPDYLKDNIFVIKGDKENPIWYKETLLNKMIDVIDTDYIIWMDNDLIYDNLDWLKDIKSVVKDKDFVQLYKTINYLDENGCVLESQKSIISSGSNDINEMLGRNYKPGGSWIGKTSIMKEQKFFEKMYVGGGDTIFVYGLFGIEEGHTLSLVKENNKYIWKEAVKWIKSNKKYRLGYLDVSINHLYHGELRDRKYDGRYKLLDRYKFDMRPNICLIYDVEGWIFQTKSINIKDNISERYDVDIRKWDDPRINDENYDIIVCYSPRCLPKNKIRPDKLICGVSSHIKHVSDNKNLKLSKYNFSNDINLFRELESEYKFYTPNGVDTKFFSYKDRTLNNKRPIRIAAVGSTRRRIHKGEERLSKITDILISDGYLIENRSIFVDPKSNNKFNKYEMLEYYKEIDIFIVSSVSEATPNPLLEAMAMHIPCISNNTGMASLLIEEGNNGYIIEKYDDIDSYVCKIKSIIDDPDLYEKFSINSRNKIVEYDWNNTAYLYSDMFDVFIKNSEI